MDDRAMSLLGNLIWLICGGLWSGILYMLAGALLCLTIIGIPFGLMAFRLGLASMAPFGKRIVDRPDEQGLLHLVFNVVWLLVAGWGIAVSHMVWALILAVTIVGLPFAKQHLKLVPVALLPFGRDLR